MRIRRSKNNGKYFQVIGQPVDVETETQKVLQLLKRKHDLKQEREQTVREARALRKQVYNLSRQINELEAETDTILLTKILKEGSG